MMVIFLVGLVSMILMRTLRKDYARYSKEEEMDDMVSKHFINTLYLQNNLTQVFLNVGSRFIILLSADLKNSEFSGFIKI